MSDQECEKHLLVNCSYCKEEPEPKVERPEMPAEPVLTDLKTLTHGECHCVSKHAPSVSSFDVHHVVPRSWGGEDGKTVVLCPTAHRNVHNLLNQYVRSKKRPSGLELRRYSTYIKQLAEEAWKSRPAKPGYTVAHGEPHP